MPYQPWALCYLTISDLISNISAWFVYSVKWSKQSKCWKMWQDLFKAFEGLHPVLQGDTEPLKVWETCKKNWPTFLSALCLLMGSVDDHHYTQWRGYTGFTLSICLSVRPSICEQNRVRSVSSTILASSILYLYILSSNFRRCIACKVVFFKIKSFVKFFTFVTFTLTWDPKWTGQ